MISPATAREVREAILNQIVTGVTFPAAYDHVLGDGAYDEMVKAVCDYWEL